MCLGIPGEIIQILNDEPMSRSGKVSFGGVVKEVNLAFVPEATVGDYVVVHVGFAISQLNAEEADQLFRYLAQMDELNELTPEQP
ncbi:MAG: HypC/HybG/HupF family hydrogenase formation chaperone [Anaerolineales bacterium]|nr:HypC/HybG/HupF family hydrogenase formation chaperone [Anaerolineales bacterium]MCB9128438.1 HypC/HybG/HupF family hydrogenase formation chaperone [Ardenticatenales bacterium]